MKPKQGYFFQGLVFCLGIVLCSKTASHAQTDPQFIGKASEILQALKADNNNIPLKVSAFKKINGVIRTKRFTESSLHIAGYIDSTKPGEFFLRAGNKVVEGSILFNGLKKGYKYTTDSDGNTFVQEVTPNQILCMDYHAVEEAPLANARAAIDGDTTVPLLESFPGANGCIYLDFDGAYVVSPYWLGGNPIQAPPSGMTTQQIRDAWQNVSEDFLPFHLNITTDLTVFNSYPNTRRQRAIISPIDVGYQSAGVAQIGSFSWDDEVPCWISVMNTSTGGLISHEVGHTLGLYHDGRTLPQEEYFGGHGNWGPIMGGGYNDPITQWSRGEYNNANNPQDDIAIIAAASGIGFRPDDFSNYTQNAFPLQPDANFNIVQEGTITSNPDVDFFTLNVPAGEVILNVSPAEFYPNLDIKIKLYDSKLRLIAEMDPADSLSAGFQMFLDKDVYYLYVSGTGHGDPLFNGYSDYGSLGKYTIRATVPGSTYCIAAGDVSSLENIAYISLAEIKNYSGVDKGYGDFTNLTATLHPGEKYTLLFQTGNSTSRKYWSAWIDFNGNGIYEDRTENVMSAISIDNSLMSKDFIVPLNLSDRITGMRIVMEFGNPPTPCGLFETGEVEDYTISIKNIVTSVAQNTQDKDGIFSTFPNPVKDVLTIRHNAFKAGWKGKVIDLTGHVLKTFNTDGVETGIDVNDLPGGCYMVVVLSDNTTFNQRFVK